MTLRVSGSSDVGWGNPSTSESFYFTLPRRKLAMYRTLALVLSVIATPALAETGLEILNSPRDGRFTTTLPGCWEGTCFQETAKRWKKGRVGREKSW